MPTLKSNTSYKGVQLSTREGLTSFFVRERSFKKAMRAMESFGRYEPTSLHRERKKAFRLTHNVVQTGNITVEINEGMNLTFPFKLQSIAKAVSEALEVLSYSEDWDDFGANATDLQTFHKAVHFVHRYSIFLLKYGILSKPFIDIMRDGSISIFWETDKATLLVIFKKNSPALSFIYGEDKKSSAPLKYALDNNVDIDEIVSIWMSKYLLSH